MTSQGLYLPKCIALSAPGSSMPWQSSSAASRSPPELPQLGVLREGLPRGPGDDGAGGEWNFQTELAQLRLPLPPGGDLRAALEVFGSANHRVLNRPRHQGHEPLPSRCLLFYPSIQAVLLDGKLLATDAAPRRLWGPPFLT